MIGNMVVFLVFASVIVVFGGCMELWGGGAGQWGRVVRRGRRRGGGRWLTFVIDGGGEEKEKGSWNKETHTQIAMKKPQHHPKISAKKYTIEKPPNKPCPSLMNV